MSNDFDVITGPGSPPPKIRPANPPAPGAPPGGADKMATLPKGPAK